MPYANHPKNWLTKLLKEHLELNANDPKKAFKGEELEALYKKAPYPISKVTRKESGEKMEVRGKYVEGDKGTNLFFVIYENVETGKRVFTTPALFEKSPALGVIDRLTNNLPIAEAREGYQTIILSPNDLVYVPTEDEREAKQLPDFDKLTKEQVRRIYKMVSSSGTQCFFIRHDVANSIVNKFEFSALNKMEKSIEGIMIKEVCIKIEVDRLGRIKPKS